MTSEQPNGGRETPDACALPAPAAAPDGELVAPVRPAPLTIQKRGRRVRTAGDVSRSTPDPEPQHGDHENDDRLRGDKPPHWG